ncbi:magnesium transporter [Thalassotalea sp. LPB0316]|uniref:magnesium transporter n=1 Tax=Thalassotalea sp. LPB0316 TaxID=2769490 RepID=UPI0018677159|nr:magnesium transporter [Thalassotalea sp. LPB0316]QOL25634.1 magnesium transporter [Thalassotalea sp. LPB0316]
MSEPLPDLIKEVLETSNDNITPSDVAIQSDSSELALLLESLPIDERIALWQTIPLAKKLDVLIDMRSDPREVLIKATESSQWDALFCDINAEDLLELADSLPQELIGQALDAMDKVQTGYFNQANEYPDEQVGHWVNHEFLILPINAKVRDANRLIRRNVPMHCDTIFLVNRFGHFSDAVAVASLHSQPEHIPLADLTIEDLPVIDATTSCHEAAFEVQNSGFAALPVVDENSKLVGRLDILAASELVREYYERQLMASAGMDEDEDLFSPVRKSAQSRAVWLGINLITAFLASAFIGIFEATIQQVVALAVLMPIVASMGGIAGSQTLTLIIRGLALNQITPANLGALLRKELKVGGLNGLIWALVIGCIAMFWFSDSMLGVVIAIAICLNIIAAAFAGVFVPVILDKLKIDPALSGSVILTTVTDIVGFVVFLGLGTLLLL